MELDITQLKFKLKAKDTIKLPEHPGSTLRGAFGHALYEIACNLKEQECEKCNLNINCAYSLLFNPFLTTKEEKKASKRFNNKPRPFVFQPKTNGKTLFKPGEKIEFNLNLFGYTKSFIPYIIESWRLLEDKGIGIGRGKFVLAEIWSENYLSGQAERIYFANEGKIYNKDLAVTMEDIKKYKNNFSTKQLKLNLKAPVLVKYNGSYAKKLKFHILMRNLFRRISAMSLFYGEKKLDIAFNKLLEIAKEIKTIRDKTSWESWHRYSNKQNKKIKMKGLLGEVEYKGDLSDFLSYLIIGELLHVGKNTVFGLGHYNVLS